MEEQLNTEITFHDSRIYELGGQWLKAENAPKLMDYFQQVFPVAQRYGVEAKARLLPESTPAGEFKPQVVA